MCLVQLLKSAFQLAYRTSEDICQVILTSNVDTKSRHVTAYGIVIYIFDTILQNANSLENNITTEQNVALTTGCKFRDLRAINQMNMNMYKGKLHTPIC